MITTRPEAQNLDFKGWSEQARNLWFKDRAFSNRTRGEMCGLMAQPAFQHDLEDALKGFVMLSSSYLSMRL